MSIQPIIFACILIFSASALSNFNPHTIPHNNYPWPNISPHSLPNQNEIFQNYAHRNLQNPLSQPTNYSIFIDSSNNKTSQDGSLSNPYSSLDQAFESLSLNQSTYLSNSNLTLIIMPHPSPYIIANNYSFTANASSIAFTSWIPVSNWTYPSAVCTTTPIITSKAILNLVGFYSVLIDSITIQPMNLLIDHVPYVTFSNLCLEEVANEGLDMIQMNEPVGLMIENLYMIFYSNKPKVVVFNLQENIAMNNIVVANGSDFQGIRNQTSCFMFLGGSKNSTFTLTNLSFDGKNQQVVITNIIYMQQIDSLTISNVMFDSLSMRPLDISLGVINAFNPKAAIFNNITVSGSKITLETFTTFFMVVSVENDFVLIQIDNLNFFNTIVSGMGSLDFIHIYMGNSFILTNHNLINNTFTNGSIIDLQNNATTTITLQIENLNISGNVNNDSQSFSYLSAYDVMMESLNVSSVEYTNNSLIGRIFAIGAVVSYIPGKIRSPKYSTVTNMTISANKAKDTSIFFFEVMNSNANQFPDYYPMVDSFLLELNNLQITNNDFAKGSSQLWLYQVGLFHSIGVWLYVNNSKIIENNFTNYGVFLLEQQLSSVFFTHSEASNNRFSRSLLIHTNYALVSISGGDSEQNGTMIATYRYSFVTFSTFENNYFYKNALFTLNNAYTIIYNNTFTNFSSEYGQLMNAGEFLPPPLTDSAPYYSRSSEYEKLTLNFDPELWAVFNNSFDLISQKNEFLVYFYLINQNEFKGFKSDVTFFIFQQYNFPQSIIMIDNNTFSHFSFYSPVMNLFVANSITYFVLQQNEFKKCEGPGYLLFMPQMGEDQLIDLNNNTIKHSTGPGLLSATGSSISGVIISDNMLENTSFWITGIDVSVVRNTGDIKIENNYFNNVSLLASNESLFTQYSLLAIRMQMSNKDCKVYIRNSTFENIFSYLDQILIKDAFQNSIFYFFIANSSLVINNISLTSANIMCSGNLMYIGAKEIYINNSYFTEINSQSLTGLIYLLSEKMHIRNNIFEVLNSEVGGTIYVASMNTRSLMTSINLVMEENYFFNCSGTLGTILYAQVPNVTLSISNNKFRTLSSVSLITISGPKSMCSGCLFVNNSIILASAISVQLITINSVETGTLTIDNTFIDMHINPTYEIGAFELYPQMTFIYALDSPSFQILVSNLSFYDYERLPIYAQILSANSIVFSLMNSEFKNILIPLTGFINLHTTKDVVGLINLYIDYVNITNALFAGSDQSLSGIISTSQNQTMLENPLDMIDKNDQATSMISVEISNSNFDYLINASAIALQKNARYTTFIYKTQFSNCRNMYGPAIFDLAQDMSNSFLSVIDSIFINNTGNLGGAILLGNTSVSLINNSFINNTAKFAGGAIYSSGDSNYLNFLPNNTFLDNVATYGNIVSSIPFKFEIEFANAVDLGINVTSFENGSALLTNVSSFSFGDLDMNIYLVDLFQKRSADFSQNPFYIFNFVNITTASAFNCSQQSCNISGLNAVVSGQAGSSIKVTVEYVSEITLPQYEFTIVLRECLVGEYNNSFTKTCDPCQPGTFSLSTNQSCQDCPAMATCAGGSMICPVQGYWSPPNSTKIYACQDASLCFGGCPSVCQEGYVGPLCGGCDLDGGYVETGYMLCGTCENPRESLTISGVIALLYFLYELTCVYTMFQGNEVYLQQPDGVHAHIEIEKAYYVRLLITYTQIISLIFNLSFNFQEYLSFLSQIGNPSNMIVYGLQCTLQAMNFDMKKYIYYATLITVLSPFAQLLGITIVVLIVKLIFKTKKARRFIYLSSIYIIMMMQPGIINHLSSMLSCNQVYPGSSYYLAYNPSWECYTEEYNFYLYFVVIPGLFLWGLVIPFLIAYRVLNNSHRLDEEKMIVTMGTFYNDMKRKYYYWGIILMTLKIIVSCLGSVMSSDLKTRILTVLIFLWAYYAAVRNYRPYRFKQFNRVETNTFLVFLCSVILAYYYLDNPYTVPRVLALIIMLVINAALLLFIISKLLKIFLLRSIYFVENKLGKRKRKLTERSLYNKPSTLLYENDRSLANSFLEEESPTRVHRTSSFDDLQAGNSFSIHPEPISSSGESND